jgi:hypothetical protein
MENVYQKAFENALSSESLQKSIAKAVLKELIDIKMNPANAEDEMVIKHVTFSTKEQDGAFMTAGDIAIQLNEIDPSIDLRVRVLGKTLAAHCEETTSDSAGRKYKVSSIGDKKPELKEIPKVTPKEAFEEPVKDSSKFLVKIQEFEDLDEMEDMLDDLEHDALVNFINVLEIDVEIGEQDDVDIVEDIMKQAKLVVENIGAAVEVAKEDQQEAEAETETEEVKDVEVAPEVEEPKKEKKKKSKKDKKDKKKKKKSKKESKE